MKENYHQTNKVFTTIIVVFLMFFCACSTKKQLTSSRNKAAVVDNATAVSTSAFRSLQSKQPYYSHFSNQFNVTPLPNPKVLTTKDKYEIAFENLQAMLNGNEAIDFEKAIFISENVYYQNKVSYDDYLKVLDWHTKRIKALIAANDKSDTMDFTTYANFRERGLSYTSLRFTEKEKRELYRKALSNWAIFTYLTDTLTFGKKEQLPFAYKIEDPFGMDNWSNSQVLHLLGSTERKGNCFALVALFKILSNRLNIEAYICTAPQHIYLQHRDVKGDFYNLELATGTYPSDGTLMTLTFTYKEAIMSGISLRRLKQEKQNIVLCLVNLGKSYEHKFQTKEDTFMLKCADLALQHDSLNLNAMLLKQQVLEERVMQYVTENSISNLTAINALESYQQLEKHTLHLYDKGYRQMPFYMQEIILSKLRKDNKPIVIKDRTPNPFTSIKVPAKNRRYSTLSGGLYEEVHETKQLEQFGYFVLDTKLRKLVKIEPNYNKDLLIDPVVFAWSVDPMAHERVSWSPYNAFRNNPILNIDPTGALDTKYEDEDGKELANTNDGNNSTVTVPNEQKERFAQMKQIGETQGVMDKPGYNYHMINTVTAPDKALTFTNQDFGMDFMRYSTRKNGVEIGGYLITDNSLIVLPRSGINAFGKEFKNTRGSGNLDALSMKNNNLNVDGKNYKATASIHTHPENSSFSGFPVQLKVGNKIFTMEPQEYGDAQVYQGSWFTKLNTISDHYVLGSTNTYKVHFRIDLGTFDKPKKIR